MTGQGITWQAGRWMAQGLEKGAIHREKAHLTLESLSFVTKERRMSAMLTPFLAA